MRQVFLDTETTGLAAAQGDRIIEIGLIEMVNRRLTGRTLHHYLNPGRSSHPDALKVHGLTDEFLADKPPFERIVDELLAFVDGAEIIIHNADFDLGFLDAEFARLGRPPFVRHVARVTDSLLLAREIYPGKGNSLDALCRRLEVDNSGRDLHGALLDAGLLAEVYIRMTRGQGALVIESADGGGPVAAIPLTDLSAFALPVIEPAADELIAHEAVLQQIDKASNGKTLWRTAFTRQGSQVRTLHCPPRSRNEQRRPRAPFSLGAAGSSRGRSAGVQRSEQQGGRGRGGGHDRQRRPGQQRAALATAGRLRCRGMRVVRGRVGIGQGLGGQHQVRHRRLLPAWCRALGPSCASPSPLSRDEDGRFVPSSTPGAKPVRQFGDNRYPPRHGAHSIA